METITFSDARNQLKQVLDRVVEDSDYTVITRRDAEPAVVMSLASFNSLMETVHLLRSPEKKGPGSITSPNSVPFPRRI